MAALLDLRFSGDLSNEYLISDTDSNPLDRCLSMDDSKMIRILRSRAGKWSKQQA
jgi:hypothetical protein